MERNDMAHMTDIAPLDGSGSFQAYVAEPAGKPRGAIIVIQEIFGVNPGIRPMCDGWAAEDYLALAPDLFWRLETGVQLVADNDQDMASGFAFYGQFVRDTGIAASDLETKRHRASGGG